MKLAKDLVKGDKINGHEKGWIDVMSVKRISDFYTEITLYYRATDTTKTDVYDKWSHFEMV